MEESRPAEEFLKNEEDPAPILIRGKNSTRLLAELADLFLALILGLVLYSLAFSPLFGFDRVGAEIGSVANSCVEEEVSSHLVLRQNDGTTLTEEGLLPLWIKQYYDGNTSTAGVSSDFLSDYYTLYRKAGLYSVAQYNVKVLGLPDNASEPSTSSYFVYDLSSSSPENTLGVINDQTKDYLKHYYAEEKTAEVLSCYQGLSDYFTKAYQTAWNEFVYAEPYYSLYVRYANLIYQRAGLASGAAATSYLVSALVIFLAVPLIKKKGTTIGKKILKLDVKNKDGTPLKIWQIFARAGVETLEYVFEIPLQGVLILGISTFTLPIIKIGGFQVTQTALFIAGVVVTLASALFMMFHPNHQSLHDFASRSYVYTSDFAIIDAERGRREKAALAKEQDDAAGI
jgi:RDD family.